MRRFPCLRRVRRLANRRRCRRCPRRHPPGRCWRRRDSCRRRSSGRRRLCPRPRPAKERQARASKSMWARAKLAARRRRSRRNAPAPARANTTGRTALSPGCRGRPAEPPESVSTSLYLGGPAGRPEVDGRNADRVELQQLYHLGQSLAASRPIGPSRWQCCVR